MVSSGPYTVVLVDDSEPYRAGIARAIDAHEDLRLVRQCDGGVSGLAAIAELEPDIAVLDIRMPDVDGLEICSRLRELRPASRTRAIVISAHMDDEVRDQALAAGASDTLSKAASRRDICSAAVRVARGID